MQKYRSDYEGETDANGARPFYAKWMGGPTLAKILDCPRNCADKPGAVYVTGEPDTYFSIPACTRVGKRYVRGYVTGTETGLEFRAMLQCEHENARLHHSRAT